MAALSWTDRIGRYVGVAGGAAGLAGALFVLFGPVVRHTTSAGDGTVTTRTLSGIDYLIGSPGAEFALFAWPVLLGGVSVVGGLAALRGRGPWIWAAAVTLGAFAVIGMASIGLLFAPAAILLLVSGVLSSAG